MRPARACQRGTLAQCCRMCRLGAARWQRSLMRRWLQLPGWVPPHPAAARPRPHLERLIIPHIAHVVRLRDGQQRGGLLHQDEPRPQDGHHLRSAAAGYLFATTGRQHGYNAQLVGRRRSSAATAALSCSIARFHMRHQAHRPHRQANQPCVSQAAPTLTGCIGSTNSASAMPSGVCTCPATVGSQSRAAS